MEQAIQLFGYLILTFLGFVVPIVGISLSVYQGGISKLIEQYKNERKQTGEKLQSQLKKIDTTDDKNITELKKTLVELEGIKKTAEDKIKNLDPKRQILKLFIPLIISFLGVGISFLIPKYDLFYYLALLISAVSFLYALYVLWNLLTLIAEIKKTIDDDRERSDANLEQLMTNVLERMKEDKSEFLEDISITLDGRNIDDISGEITVVSDKKQEFKFGLRNSETRMAKNVEVGFIFPTDFIIEKSTRYSIYTDETRQIVRYTSDYVHGKERRIYEPLVLTPLKEGPYKIDVFIKGENIEPMRKSLNLKVVR